MASHQRIKAILQPQDMGISAPRKYHSNPDQEAKSQLRVSASVRLVQVRIRLDNVLGTLHASVGAILRLLLHPHHIPADVSQTGHAVGKRYKLHHLLQWWHEVTARILVQEPFEHQFKATFDKLNFDPTRGIQSSRRFWAFNQ